MKILLTGSEGFVGKALYPMLEAEGHKITRCDLKIGLPYHEFHCFYYDLVIHLAAHKDVRESVSQPEKYMENNAYGLLSFFNPHEFKCPRRLIHFSSAAAKYPVNPYGVSKLVSEALIQKLHRIPNSWVILRPENIVGEGMGGVLPIMKRAKETGEPVTLRDSSRDFISVEAICEYVLNIIRNDNFDNTIRSVGSGINESVQRLARKYEIPFTEIDCDWRDEPRHSYATERIVPVGTMSKWLEGYFGGVK
jgi:nucleoside-diphosphate-sugar epimerase